MNNPQLQAITPGQVKAYPEATAADFHKWKLFDSNGKELGSVWRRSENVWLWGAPRSDTDSNSNQCDINTAVQLEQLYHSWVGKQVVE